MTTNTLKPTTTPQCTNSSHDELFFQLGNQTFSFGLLLFHKGHVPITWIILQAMAGTAGLKASHHPYKRPNLDVLRIQFASLAKTIETSDLPKAREVLSDMLRTAYLS